MENLKSIKDRIYTVNSLIKATNAMKMVSTIKLARFNNTCKFSKECSERLLEMLSIILSNLIFEKKIDQDHWLVPKSEDDQTLILVISASRGFCGAFNQSIIESTKKLISYSKNYKVKIFGKKASVISPENVVNVNDWYDIRSFTSQIYDVIIDNLKYNRISKIIIISGRYKNSFTQKAESFQVFPIIFEKTPKYVKVDGNEIELVEEIFYSYTMKLLYSVIIEHIIAELSARVIAMDSSVKNARGMNKNLNALYNRIRQSRITQELTEIVTSMESIQ
jgi:F-type H+-transporting ATPase subunit gamma